MGTGHPDRLWLIGGALGALVLVAVGWFFLISPQDGQTAALNSQTDAAHTQLIPLQHRLNELQKQNEDIATYRDKLAADQAALPSQPDLAAFLRGLQTGDSTNGVVSGVTVGAPLEVQSAGRRVFALQLSVTANGSSAQLNGLLDYLQRVQPRAVLVKNVQLGGDNKSTLGGGSSSLTVALEVFVAEPDSTPAATSGATTN